MVLHSRFEGADVAADIIGAGPEPLTSQFAAGYGMVLNLLHTRSLADARAFLERSFGNYMGAVLPFLSMAHGSGFRRSRVHAKYPCLPYALLRQHWCVFCRFGGFRSLQKSRFVGWAAAWCSTCCARCRWPKHVPASSAPSATRYLGGALPYSATFMKLGHQINFKHFIT